MYLGLGVSPHQTGAGEKIMKLSKPQLVGVENYAIAFQAADGDWDYAETFHADNDAAANEYAQRNYAGQEWYVVDEDGDNING